MRRGACTKRPNKPPPSVAFFDPGSVARRARCAHPPWLAGCPRRHYRLLLECRSLRHALTADGCWYTGVRVRTVGVSRIVLGLLLVATLVAGCGGDGGIVIFRFSSGTIAGDPFCRDGGGQFDLLQQGGLTVLVVLASDTVIFTGTGITGSCTDLFDGDRVQVTGPEASGVITAREVRVQ